jgi:hypothetical protein
MPIEKGFCKECDQNVKIERRPINLLLHGLLTVVTGGVWLIPFVCFLIARLGGYQWKCSECGTSEVDIRN